MHGPRLLPVLALFFSFLGLYCRAADPPERAPSPVFARRAEQEYQTNRVQFRSMPNKAEVAWQFGRACYDWADFSQTNKQREEIAKEGMAACRRAMELEPDSAPAHYYLALNIGQLAQTKMLGALKLVDDMEAELLKAISLDAKFDYAGANRALAILYAEAPGWPASIGSKGKARHSFDRAMALAPEYPDNSLSYFEAALKWGDRKTAERERRIYAELLTKARQTFSGVQWEASWADWDSRWTAANEKARQKWPTQD
jgi:hypothetical protein